MEILIFKEMGIEAVMTRLCVQKAVYWGNPIGNGTGGFIYDPPIEIPCRWEDTAILVSDKEGNDLISKAVIYVLQDLDEEGMICLNSLDNLDSSLDIDPNNVDNTYIIKRFDKLPALKSSTEFLRKAYLTV
jgi:hypothetical protein